MAGSALVLSARQARIEPTRLAAFTRPVYVVYGNLSHPAWRTMSQTLSKLLPDCTVEVYEGLHHLSPPQRAQPERQSARNNFGDDPVKAHSAFSLDSFSRDVFVLSLRNPRRCDPHLIGHCVNSPTTR